ncbi:hypothetical protein OH76DRAFT_657744 [Lentinus brumalis]|uniref:Uncharacterized protein n=1 Tax=Lentinus brumalis TaxID=2498619 RepID=A0A371D7K8_9APHY|nr:hypothetical protein OH76DRAFT_657744 [Polyporus brumalis]
MQSSSTAGADLCRRTRRRILLSAPIRAPCVLPPRPCSFPMRSHRRNQEPTTATHHDCVSSRRSVGEVRVCTPRALLRLSSLSEDRSPQMGSHAIRLPSSRVTAARDTSPPLHCAPIVRARVQVTESHIKSLSHGSRTQCANARHAELPSVLVGLDCAGSRSRSRVLSGVRVSKVAGGHGGCQSHSRERPDSTENANVHTRCIVHSEHIAELIRVIYVLIARI